MLSFKRQLLLLTTLVILLAACGEEAPPPTTPTAASLAAPTTVAQADTPTAAIPTSAAAEATTLPLPPTVAVPATLTPFPTPEATATGIPIVLSTLADFGSDRNPLTGELVTDPSVLLRRPLAVKISNSPAEWVRPQSGLNDADIVYEHITEGLITRFTAIFYDTAPARIGPIRSARLIDLEIPAMYDAALGFSGASIGVNSKLNRADFNSRIMYSWEPGYYRTGENKPYEHTLYGDPLEMWNGLTAKGENVAPTFSSLMTFSDVPAANGQPASSVTIDYEWELMEWRYDVATGRYLRFSSNLPHIDANDNEQVNVANVIIVIANHVEDANICEQITNDRCVALSVEAQIWGSGPVLILRDGQVFEGTWQRVNRSDMLTFFDAAGNPIPLKIGNSWVNVVPTWFANPINVTP